MLEDLSFEFQPFEDWDCIFLYMEHSTSLTFNAQQGKT